MMKRKLDTVLGSISELDLGVKEKFAYLQRFFISSLKGEPLFSKGQVGEIFIEGRLCCL
jgi:hypothetical protein